MDEVDVKEYLLETDTRFRELADEHRNYERQLKELHAKPYLSGDEHLEEVIIKKKKLAVKDQMQILIYRYQSQHSHQ
jgi:uncharacterized protein YdcH (DUF465 family)